jgi:phosphinothricin acetyltransferase
MIRAIEPKDLQKVCDIYNHYILTTNASFEVDPVAMEEMQRRVNEVTSTHPWLVCEEDDDVVGFAYASKWKPRPAYRFTSEVTIYLDKDHLGKGIGKMLYQELFARLKVMGIHSMIATIAIPNENSIQLHESFGFKQVGQFKEMGNKFGEWLDVGYWHCMV